jgi:hypothetical protein
VRLQSRGPLGSSTDAGSHMPTAGIKRCGDARSARADASRRCSGCDTVLRPLHVYTAMHFGRRSAGLHPDYPWTSESSRSFGSETMRSRPKESGKTLRRPTTGAPSYIHPNAQACALGTRGPQRASCARRGSMAARRVRATLSRSSVLPACGAVSEANERFDSSHIHEQSGFRSRVGALPSATAAQETQP